MGSATLQPLLSTINSFKVKGSTSMSTMSLHKVKGSTMLRPSMRKSIFNKSKWFIYASMNYTHLSTLSNDIF